MIAAYSSELTRTARKGALGAWFGLTALFAALMFFAIFQFVDSAEGAPARGPGVAFPSVETLTSSAGILSPLAAASSMFGVACLAFWAVFTAADYSSGLIRLLVIAQPSRSRLVGGKLGALVTWTLVAATVALIATMMVAPMASAGTSLDITQWRSVSSGEIVAAWVNLALALVVWGSIGMMIATLSRSAAIAVSVGAGWVLLIEGVLAAIAPDLADWLPGTTIGAIASGGSNTVGYGTALALGGVYLALCIGVTIVVSRARDVTD